MKKYWEDSDEQDKKENQKSDYCNCGGYSLYCFRGWRYYDICKISDKQNTRTNFPATVLGIKLLKELNASTKSIYSSD